jgi:hypothetical protein
MCRRLILPLTFAVSAAALLFPSSVAAVEGFDHVVKYNFCRGVDPHFKVTNRAAGWTNANKLTIETWVERRPANGDWKIVFAWKKAKYAFDVNGDKHWLTSWRTWDGDREFWYRIGFRLRAWHNSKLLSSTTIYSVKC